MTRALALVHALMHFRLEMTLIMAEMTLIMAEMTLIMADLGPGSGVYRPPNGLCLAWWATSVREQKRDEALRLEC